MAQLIIQQPPAPFELYPAPSGDRSLYRPAEPQGIEHPLSKSDRKTKFRSLVKQWKEQTAHLSSAARMASHPAYQEIIGMGEQVVPLLLAELSRKPDFWFAALRAITGADPVPPESAGNIKAMAQAWIEWGRCKGYIK